MKIRILFTFIAFILINFIGYSQIVLTETDLPVPGDIQTSSKIDSIEGINILPGDSGANKTWFFDTYNLWGGTLESSADSVRWVVADSLLIFPLSNIALLSNCYLWHDWVSHTLKEKCFRDYYIKDTTGLNYYASSYPHANYLPDYRNVFPILQYGQSKTDHSRILIQKSSDSTFVTNITDSVFADAWGEVITLMGNYNTIRIHTKETVWDSLYINGVGQLVNYMPNNYYYKWYTKDLGFPVLQINKGIMEKRNNYQIVKFAVSKRNEIGIKDNFITNNNVKIFPNPFTNEARIFLSNKNSTDNLTMYIYDLTGRQVSIIKNISSTNNIINKNNLPAGMYSFAIRGDKEYTGTGKFIIL
ncbi:MAG: T9SS type A sorting domain-containing protein [Bacteroidia bacterium]|nr:T9SS type A sorting domain-containing protein [Bacteroidia bacterium]